MEIPKELKDEIWEYCRSNDILNVNDFMLRLVKQGFTIEKFGATPNSNVVEKIVEKIVEVPVEKEVFITDDTSMKKLTNDLNKVNDLNTSLESEVARLTKELAEEKIKNKKDIYGEG
jgi:hypothetical protein